MCKCCNRLRSCVLVGTSCHLQTKVHDNKHDVCIHRFLFPCTCMCCNQPRNFDLVHSCLQHARLQRNINIIISKVIRRCQSVIIVRSPDFSSYFSPLTTYPQQCYEHNCYSELHFHNLKNFHSENLSIKLYSNRQFDVHNLNVERRLKWDCHESSQRTSPDGEHLKSYSSKSDFGWVLRRRLRSKLIIREHFRFAVWEECRLRNDTVLSPPLSNEKETTNFKLWIYFVTLSLTVRSSVKQWLMWFWWMRFETGLRNVKLLIKAYVKCETSNAMLEKLHKTFHKKLFLSIHNRSMLLCHLRWPGCEYLRLLLSLMLFT